MKTVYILIGPPLSGKSTFRKKFANAFVICRDDILMELSGEEDYEKAFSTVNQKEVDRLLMEKFEIAKNQEVVIVDMTHMASKRRKYNLSFFPDHKKIAVIFDFPSKEEYEKRNAKRITEEKKSISYGIFKNMIDSYQQVSKEEGFDQILPSEKIFIKV